MNNENALKYPETRRVEQIDTYHGVAVPDPYRWLEDTDSPETREWVEAQNAVTFGYLESLPARDALRKRLSELWDFERFGLPFRRGGRLFFTRNDGLQNQAVLYVQDAGSEEPRVLLDPNTLRADGTVALSTFSVSLDGGMLAYALAAAGSDWVEWKVRDVATGEDLEDHLLWSKFGGAAWAIDGSGFYYNRYPEPAAGQEYEQANLHQRVFFHTVGEPQESDRLVFERPDQPSWMFSTVVSEDGRWLVIHISRDTGRTNDVTVLDLHTGERTDLFTGFEAEHGFLGNEGDAFWFETNRDAPRGKVVRVDLRNPEPSAWCEVIPESEDALMGASLVGGTLFAQYLHDAHSRVEAFTPDGESKGEVALPGLGSAGGFGGRNDDTETWFAYSDFFTPAVVYRHDIATGVSTVFRKPDVAFDGSEYEARQVFFESKDGTRIPMFLAHRNGISTDGMNPTLLYGYGGFSASMTPAFSVFNLAWMEMGGVYAMPNLRGGGEYGEDWHVAGTKQSKQNVFDDFIAAAEWLIDNGFTSPDKLAISGGSNGGLLVGAAMTQRPDLFGAALPAVGVMDMLRYHLFTIGWAWASDYGTVEDPDEFRALHAYSPYHNIKPGTHYPATLVTTGDHDDRVVPGHSFKFAAALQACQAGDSPVLIRIDTRAGHGAGKPTDKLIEEAADKLAFLANALGMRQAVEVRSRE